MQNESWKQCLSLIFLLFSCLPRSLPVLVKSSREECFVPSLKIQVMKENPKIHPFITVISQLWHLS